MSTRCNVIIKDQYSTIYIYRHSDGYPSCAGEDLKEFVKGYASGLMRRDAMQSAGWLILHGHVEYLESAFTGKPTADKFSGWKVGAYEPTTQIHGDVEYVYTIDLCTQELSCDQADEFPTVSFKRQTAELLEPA